MISINTFPWKQFCRYAIVGGTGFVLDMATLMLFKEVFHWGAVPSVAINQSLIIVINFTLNKYWSFQNTHMPHWQFVRYLLLAGFNYILSISMMALFHTLLDIDYRVVRVGSIALSVTWNFYLYRHWVYQK